MQRVSWRLVLVAALAVLPALLLRAGAGQRAAWAAESRYGNVIFTPPAGWTRVQQQSALLFIAPHAAKGDAAVLGIAQGQVLTGTTFRAWFDAAIRASLGTGERVVTAGTVTAARGDNAYDVLYTSQVVQDASGARTYRFFLGAHPGTRVELIVYYASSQQAFTQDMPVLQRFIAGVRFANLQQPAHTVTPQATPASPGGTGSDIAAIAIYTGQTTGLVFVANIGAPGGGSYQYRTRTYTYTFLPGHRVFNGLPPADSFATACARSASGCGSYTDGGGSLRISWDDGTSTSLTVAGNGASLQLGRVTLYRASPVQAIDGTYGNSTYVDTSGAGGTGGVSGDHTIAFGGDGTFSASNFVGSVQAGDSGGVTTSSDGTSAGRYAIHGYILQLAYQNGVTAQHVLFAYAGGADPAAIAVDGITYTRRG